MIARLLAFLFILNCNCFAITFTQIEKNLEEIVKNKIISNYQALDYESLKIQVLNKDQFKTILSEMDKEISYQFDQLDSINWQQSIPIKINLYNKNNVFLKDYTLFVLCNAEVNVWKAKHDLGVGKIIELSDLDKLKKSLYNINKSLIFTSEKIIGKEVKIKIRKDDLFRTWHLREKVLVNKGQDVVVSRKTSSLSITVVGKALEDGSKDNIISIRMPDGKIISGKVENEGTVIFSR